MNKEQIMETIKELAKSQGLYCRVLEEVEEHEEILNMLEKQHFNDVIDLVMFIEC